MTLRPILRDQTIVSAALLGVAVAGLGLSASDPDTSWFIAPALVVIGFVLSVLKRSYGRLDTSVFERAERFNQQPIKRFPLIDLLPAALALGVTLLAWVGYPSITPVFAGLVGGQAFVELRLATWIRRWEIDNRAKLYGERGEGVMATDRGSFTRVARAE